MADLARALPGVLFVVDESYLPFAGPEKELSLAGLSLPNVLVLASFSKMYVPAGIRAGACCASPEIIRAVRKATPPWSVNTLAQAAVTWLARNPDRAHAHAMETRRFCAREKARWLESFADHPGMDFFPGAVNFLLARLGRGIAQSLQEHLLEKRILIRDCANFAGLSPSWFRVSVRGEQENQRLRQALARWLAAA